MKRIRVWMCWWIICPTLRVMHRKFNQTVFQSQSHYILVIFNCIFVVLLPRRHKKHTRLPLISIVHCRFEVEPMENGGSVPDNRKLSERSVEDLTKNTMHSATQGMTRAARAFTVRSVTWPCQPVAPIPHSSILLQEPLYLGRSHGGSEAEVYPKWNTRISHSFTLIYEEEEENLCHIYLTVH